MKSMFKRIVSKMRRDNRGMSLVEVLCAVAILSLITGVIGSVIVISTRTYRKGISETNIQQEAQLAANNIGNIVKDACSVIYGSNVSTDSYSNGGFYYKNGDVNDKVPDGGAGFKKQTENYTELSIITNDDVQYTMTFDKLSKMLLYREYDVNTETPRTESEVMAKNILSFTADTRDFKKNKTIKLNIMVEDADTSRQLPLEYTMTSRNGEGEGGTYVSSTDDVVIVFVEGDVVMVPGETYEIPITVAGKLREGLEWGSVTGLNTGALTLTYAEVTVPRDTINTTGELEIHTKDKKEDGSPKASASSHVRIRKVNQVAVSHSINRDHSKGHMIETAGAEYTFSANVTGNELAKNVAYNYDSNYKTAQAVFWGWVLELDGAELARREWTGAWNAEHNQWEYAAHDTGDGAEFDKYIEVKSEKSDALLPELVLKLKKDLPAGFKLTVRATSQHALGINKADLQEANYYNALLADPRDVYYGEDWIEPRETILHKDLEIILEPQETGRIALGMKGGLTDKVTFSYDSNAKDLAADLDRVVKPEELENDDTIIGTRAVYDADTDEAVIKLGKAERGSGPTGTDPYTFTIDALVNGEKKSTIAVHVCRVDQLSIEVFDNFTGTDKTTVQKLPTYDFRARFNVGNGKNDAAMQNAIKYLIQYKADGTPDKAVVEKTLSAKITWELEDHSTGKTIAKQSVICMAGVGSSDKGVVKDEHGTALVDNTGKFTTEGKKLNKKEGYFEVVNIKPSRIEKDADGKWFIKQLPEIDISPEAATDTGLPANCELTVTIEALHPLGTDSGTKYNKTGKPYGEAKAMASVEGDLTLDIPKLVIVEPGQGTDTPEPASNAEWTEDDKRTADKGLVIPIQVHGGAVYSMDVKITGKTDDNTKLSSYPQVMDTYKNRNPYMVGNATSAGTRTWYMGLKIGKDETGGKDGCPEGQIKVEITAKNSQGKVISKDNVIYLAVRRVEKVAVNVRNAKKFSDVNVVNDKNITLEASPSGIKDTEYFAEQTDREARWEQKNHGEYKPPYRMEWKMLIHNDDKTEKALGEWTEYFDFGTDAAAEGKVDNSNQKATITFKLKQPLPYGTKIRAYSLHAQGSNGKKETESGYVKYNKSGQKYADVYGELSLGDDVTVADGFKRGKDYTFIKDTDIPYVIADPLGWMKCLEQASFYRFREVGGTWSKYHMMDSHQGNWAVANYVPMSYLFRPDKEYDIEVVSVVYNKTDRLIYWPMDNELLEAGRGWSEAGFTFWQLTQEQWQKDWPGGNQYYHPYSEYQELYNKVKAISEVKQTFRIPKSEMSFNTRADASSHNSMTVDKKVTSVGSESEPIRLSGTNGDASNYSGFIVDLEITGYEMNTDQQCFRTIVQKKSGNKWITLGYDDDSAIHDTEGFKVDSANPYISIYRTGNAKGLYRVVPVILTGEKIKWRDVTETPRSGHTDMDILFNPEYTTTEENYHLYDYDTGKYVIYFEFY